MDALGKRMTPHPSFPAELETLSLLAQMQEHMAKAGVASFAAVIASAREELDGMPKARAEALGARFWTKRLVGMANRALRDAGKGERWTEVKLEGNHESLDPLWLLMTPTDGRDLEARGIGRRVRPRLRWVSLPFLLIAVGLGVVAYREQTTGAIALALAGYLVWFVATQVAARISGGRS
jgi:hypothetical protein